MIQCRLWSMFKGETGWPWITLYFKINRGLSFIDLSCKTMNEWMSYRGTFAVNLSLFILQGSLGSRIVYKLRTITFLISSKGYSLCEQSTLWVYFFSRICYHHIKNSVHICNLKTYRFVWGDGGGGANDYFMNKFATHPAKLDVCSHLIEQLNAAVKDLKSNFLN